MIAALMFVGLPESLQFLVLRRGDRQKVARWLKRHRSDAVGGAADVEFVVQEENKAAFRPFICSAKGARSDTVLLWLINFMNIYNLTCCPAGCRRSRRSSATPRSTSVLDRDDRAGGRDARYVLADVVHRQVGLRSRADHCFLVAFISIALIGQPGLALWMLVTVVFIAGSCVVGGQPTVNALSGTYYPTYLRSTGIGWGLGIGRAGAIVGPWLVGQFMAAKWSIHDIFYASADSRADLGGRHAVAALGDAVDHLAARRAKSWRTEASRAKWRVSFTSTTEITEATEKWLR